MAGVPSSELYDLPCNAPVRTRKNRLATMLLRDDGSAAGYIRTALTERGAGKTVCPSEIARRLAGEDADWRPRMGEVHAAVDVLVSTGEVALSWKGATLAERRGPYRIGRPK